jgi:hypothetical protein
MADGQFGGNGSVHWRVDGDVGNSASGVDYGGGAPGQGNDFVIRIRVPANPNWLDQLRNTNPVNGVLEFTLPINGQPAPEPQIQVCWGRVPPGLVNKLA